MPLGNFGIIAPQLYRSAQPDAHGLAIAVALGVDLVLKLNTDEEGQMPARPDVVVWHWPLGLTAPHDGETYAQVRFMAKAIADGQTLLVQCTHGRDRTGFVAAAYQIVVLGWTLAQVAVDREAHGVDNFISKITNHSFTESLERIAAVGTPL